MKILFKIIFILGISFYPICSIAESIDIDNYNTKVVDSNEAWLIKYYSDRCGTCIEFEPVWLSVINKIKELKIGKVNIDEKNGMDLAVKNNILEEGIPQVKLVYGKNGQQVTIMAGDVIKEEDFVKNLKKNIIKLLKSSDGLYIKEDL